MNAQRRARLFVIQGELMAISCRLEDLADEECESAENMPTRGDRYEQMQANEELLRDAVENLSDCVDNITEAQGFIV